jgi:N-ethylmaleimide reductase
MLFDSFKLGSLTLSNRVVMAPMTRSRAIDNLPSELVVQYYAQRASAGLIITEGVSPSPNGLGYARIPGLFNAAQKDAWRKVTDAVHAAGGRIFVQLMHSGRIGHVDNLPAGARLLGPGAEACPGDVWTDKSGMQANGTPQAMTEADIAAAREEYVQSAKLAIAAGFDGIELHAANGYLLEQFLNANVNQRTDAYGGSAAARNRFVLEVAAACVEAIGADRVGMRVSPFGVFNATGPFEGVEAQFLTLAQEAAKLGLVYLHLVDHSAMGAPPVPAAFKQQLRSAFGGTFIAVGGLDAVSGEAILQNAQADLAAFGRPFISNPDLVARLRAGAALTPPDMETFYTPGEKGYTDYPVMA